jgi:hypothetical protein
MNREICCKCKKNISLPYHAYCRNCKLEYDREYYNGHKEKRMKNVKKWIKNNPEKHKQYQKNCEKNNHEKHLEYRKKWRKSNPEKCRIFGRTFREKNSEKIKRYKHKRERELDFIPLNFWFENSHAHHITNIHILYIPKDLHLSCNTKDRMLHRKRVRDELIKKGLWEKYFDELIEKAPPDYQNQEAEVRSTTLDLARISKKESLP